MNTQTAMALGAGVAGLGVAAGVHLAMRAAVPGTSDAAMAEWNDWHARLDAEFPKAGGGDLRRPISSDADEQRFEQFLADNPAPSWIRTEHEDLRAISIDPFEPDPKGTNWKPLAAAALGVGGGLALGITGAELLHRAGSAGSTAGLALNVGGIALGLGTIASTFLLPRGDEATQHIESTEWHVPSKWYH